MNTQQFRPRLPLIDTLRGTALMAMFVYHFVWDLGYFGLVDPETPRSTGFLWFGHVIAGIFMALAGAGLVLALRNPFDWTAFSKRLALITGAAALITAVTYALFPNDFIYFGILHCIALSSLLALPFLRAPLLLVIAVAIAALLAPTLLRSTSFDAFWLSWTGLGIRIWPANDYRPLLPWFGTMLLGIAAMRSVDLAQLSTFKAGNSVSKSLVWGGRHSLFVYLVHQPIFFGLLWLVALLPLQRAVVDETPFLRDCVKQCSAAGANRQICTSACNCVVRELKTADIWSHLLANKISPEEKTKLDALSLQCWRNELKKPPAPPQ
jgi:uncharacterized membrane protein